MCEDIVKKLIKKKKIECKRMIWDELGDKDDPTNEDKYSMDKLIDNINDTAYQNKLISRFCDTKFQDDVDLCDASDDVHEFRFSKITTENLSN